MDSCRNLKALNYWQFTQLQEHISKHRYYEGEHHHYFNTANELEQDFISHFFEKVAKEMRLEFCSHQCPFYNDCEIAKILIDNDKK